MKAARFLAPLFVAASLSGCGGELFNANVDSAYMGSWVGPWDDTSTTEGGSFDIDVSRLGVITGTTSRISDGVSGTVTGTVDREGTFNVTVDFTTGQDYTSVHGTMTRTSSGIIGVFNYSGGVVSGTANFTLSVPSGRP